MVARCTETLTTLRRGEAVETRLQRIAEKARREPNFKFTSLLGLLDMDLLRECFSQLNKNAAAGIDGMTKEAYGIELDANLQNLVDRLHTLSYKPQPVRRKYIPKPGSIKGRPLGIPCFEDKLVQAGIVKPLEAVYEQDFIEDSFGFRPGRSCHDALKALSETVENNPVSYIVEADIKGFFNNVSQEWLLKFLGHRIGDKRILRIIARILKAGVCENGNITQPEDGTPQGGVISPLLANIYLHYALDLWFEKVIRKSSTGYVRIIRYADDFVTCFQYKADAVRFYEELPLRLAKFGLEVEPSKTQMIEFGRFAIQNVRNGNKPATFSFLGFTHYCSTGRDGKRFRMKRVTDQKKFAAKVLAFKEWLKKARNMKIKDLWALAGVKLTGHYNYYGVTDNTAGIRRFESAIRKLLHKWLNRRSQRSKLTWDRFAEMMEWYPLPVSRIKVSMFPS